MGKRAGTYNGGGTSFSGRDSSWFGGQNERRPAPVPRDALRAPPERTAQEQAEIDAFAAEQARPKLIKAKVIRKRTERKDRVEQARREALRASARRRQQ